MNMPSEFYRLFFLDFMVLYFNGLGFVTGGIYLAIPRWGLEALDFCTVGWRQCGRLLKGGQKMLGEWTWQDFGLWAGMLLLCWYGCLCWRYRKELSGMFGRGRTSYGRPLVAGTAKTVSGVGRLGAATSKALVPDDAGVMGKVRLPEGMEQLGDGDFGFAPLDDEGKLEALGLVADVMEELKGLIADLSAGDGEKADFLAGMESIRGRYPKMAGHPRLAQLNAFILEHVPFALSDVELEGLWD